MAWLKPLHLSSFLTCHAGSKRPGQRCTCSQSRNHPWALWSLCSTRGQDLTIPSFSNKVVSKALNSQSHAYTDYSQTSSLALWAPLSSSYCNLLKLRHVSLLDLLAEQEESTYWETCEDDAENQQEVHEVLYIYTRNQTEKGNIQRER